MMRMILRERLLAVQAGGSGTAVSVSFQHRQAGQAGNAGGQRGQHHRGRNRKNPGGGTAGRTLTGSADEVAILTRAATRRRTG